MFGKISTKKKNGKVYKFLQVVETYRDGNKIKHRPVCSIGSLTKFPPERISELIKCLIKFSDLVVHNINEDFRNEEAQTYAPVLLASTFFYRIGIGEVLATVIQQQKIEFDPLLLVEVMVINRLLDPRSKLDIMNWLPTIYLRGTKHLAEIQYHQLLRAMDILIDSKQEIEKRLYEKLVDLFNLEVDIVFYDITSSYFEGDNCSLAEHGKSRDNHPELLQIVIGLVVTREGLPICHYVFSGNTPDKTTVKGTIDDLKNRFKLRHIIFVGDRGMKSETNLKKIIEAEYDYIIGLPPRVSNEVKDILPKTLSGYKPCQDMDLSFKEIKRNKKRYVIGYNKEVARTTRKHRREAIKKTEIDLQALKKKTKDEIMDDDEIAVAASNIVNKYYTKKYFKISADCYKLSYKLKDEVIKFENSLDGKFILKVKTKQDISAEEVIASYKNLSRVEDAFREIKGFLKIRPIYHYNDNRVRAHVFICVIAFLIEKVIELNLKRLGIKYSVSRLLDKLDNIKVVKNQIVDREFYGITSLDKDLKKILDSLKVPLPSRIFQKDKKSPKDIQLMLL